MPKTFRKSCFMLIALICLGEIILSITLTSNKENTSTKTKYHYAHATEWNDRGEGHVYYLDRHTTINCVNSFLSGFHLDRDGERIRYQFSCSNANLNRAPKETYKSRMINSNKLKQGTKSFANHLTAPVMCPQGKALVSFRLYRRLIQWNSFYNRYYQSQLSQDNPVQYEFQCAPIPWNYRCGIQRQTDWTYMHKGLTEYLDRQNVQVGHNEILKGFTMEFNRRTSHIRYRYEVCALN